MKRRILHLDRDSMRNLAYVQKFVVRRRIKTRVRGCEPMRAQDGVWWWKRVHPGAAGVPVKAVKPVFCKIGDVLIATPRKSQQPDPAICEHELLVELVTVERYYAHAGWTGETADIYLRNGRMIVDNPWAWVAECWVDP